MSERPRQSIALDGLRAVGAILVLLVHGHLQHGALTTSTAERLLTIAASVFALQFFIISAFLLFEPMAFRILGGRPPVAVNDFYRRRIRRIVPPAWLAIIVYILWVPGITQPKSWVDWFAVLGFNQEWSERWLYIGVPPLWTMCIEVLFYAALPIGAIALARAVRKQAPAQALRRLLVILIAFGLIGPIFRLVTKLADPAPLTNSLLWVRWPFAYFDWLAIGMVIALVHAARRAGLISLDRIRVLNAPTWAWWAVAAGLMWIWEHAHTALLLTPEPVGSYMLWTTLAPLAAICITLPLFLGNQQPGGIERILGSGPAVWLGSISFGMYLWHWAIIAALVTSVDWFDGLPTVARDLILFALSVAAGAASWYAIERPLLSPSRRMATS